MKIGICSDILRNQKTGVEKYTEELVLNLCREFPQEDFYLIRQEGQRDRFDGLKILETRKRPRFFGSRFIYSLMAPPGMFSGFDLVHCPTHEAPFFRKQKNKTIMTIHDLTPLVLPAAQKFNRVFYFKYFLKPLLERFDHIIADSFSTKNDLMKFFGIPESKISAVPLGYDFIFRPQSPDPAILQKYRQQPGYLFFMGTVEPRKNIVRLLEAFQIIKEKIDGRLVIAGGLGWKYKKILEKIQKEPGVDFLGYVPDEDLVALYNGASVFIYPSLYEGFGLPVLEAMACGKPVVTSDNSSLPEITGSAALLVNPLDVRKMAEVILELFLNRDLQAELSEKARQRAASFSWVRTARETFRVYEAVVAG
jgi:glycosyltransferase involved in cell wall biosynthesis